MEKWEGRRGNPRASVRLEMGKRRRWGPAEANEEDWEYVGGTAVPSKEPAFGGLCEDCALHSTSRFALSTSLVP